MYSAHIMLSNIQIDIGHNYIYILIVRYILDDLY